MPKPAFKREKTVIDATGRSIGRIAAEAAKALQGKHRAAYEPRLDNGDIVEIKNAAKVKVTGKKLEQKIYYHYSGYPGGLKTKKMSQVLAEKPGEVLIRAVKQMLPKNRLRQEMIKRLIIK